MNLLHRARHELDAMLGERATVRALGRLGDRGLADLGLTRDDVRHAARIAARQGPSDTPLRDLQERLALARAAALAARDETPGTSRQDLARHVAEGRRLRDEEFAKLGRAAGGGLVRLARALAAPVAALAEATGLSRELALARVRRRERARIEAELGTYSDRELMADLRIARSEIGDIAAEGAERGVDEFVRAHPAYREAWSRRARRAAAGFGHARG